MPTNVNLPLSPLSLSSPDIPENLLSKFSQSVRAACGVPEDAVGDPQIDQEIDAASRILWFYLLLDDDHRPDFEFEIERMFDTSEDDHKDHLNLFLKEIRQAFDEIYDGSSTASQLDLVAHLETLVTIPVATSDLPVNQEFESLAEFAEPLICCQKVLDNPELIDEMMMRAHDYWELAIEGNAQSDSRFASIVSKYAQNGVSPADIRSEAVMMIERFDSLYGDNRVRPNA